METTLYAPSSAAGPELYRPLPKPSAFQTFRTRYGTLLVTTINILIFLWLWQRAQGGPEPLISTRFIPAPMDILEKVAKTIGNGRLWKNGSFSLLTYVTGMSISIFIFVPVGILLGINPLVRSVSETYVWILYTTPTIALLPIITVLLGFGLEAKVLLVSLQTIPPILVNVIRGVGTVDPTLLKAGRLFGANTWQQLRKIIFPSMLPWVMTGLRIASRRGLMAVIIAEMFGSLRGLTNMLMLAMDQFDTATAFAAIAALMMIAIVFVNGLDWVETKATPWRQVLKI